MYLKKIKYNTSILYHLLSTVYLLADRVLVLLRISSVTMLGLLYCTREKEVVSGSCFMLSRCLDIEI